MQEAVARFIGLRGLLAALFLGENTYFASSGALVTVVPPRAHRPARNHFLRQEYPLGPFDDGIEELKDRE